MSKKSEKHIEIGGVIYSKIGADKWSNEFIDWIESRNEHFGGAISDCKEDDEAEPITLEELKKGVQLVKKDKV